MQLFFHFKLLFKEKWQCNLTDLQYSIIFTYVEFARWSNG